MKEFELKEDINLIVAQAKTFPSGVVSAYQELERAIGDPKGRQFYGLSRGDKGGVLYWAAVRPIKDEQSRLGFESRTISKGTYLTETLTNWRGREHVIGETFQKMLGDPRLDPNGYCVEWYQDNDDVICMVRILPG